jgi:hypothetical protein
VDEGGSHAAPVKILSVSSSVSVAPTVEYSDRVKALIIGEGFSIITVKCSANCSNLFYFILFYSFFVLKIICIVFACIDSNHNVYSIEIDPLKHTFLSSEFVNSSSDFPNLLLKKLSLADNVIYLFYIFYVIFIPFFFV